MRIKSVIFLLSCVFTISAVGTAQRYTITDLGPLSPTAINNWAQVVGAVSDQATMWSRSTGFRKLGLLSGGSFSRPTGINDFGWVTGIADGTGIVVSNLDNYPNVTCGELTQPFIWKPGRGLQGLGTVGTTGWLDIDLWCFTPFYALGINEIGQIAGYTKDIGTSYQWAFEWKSSNGFDLFGGSWNTTNAFGISNTGQIVGQDPVLPYFYIEAFGHAVSWKNGDMTDLGVLIDTTDPDFLGYVSSANGVNDLGQIVGWASTSASLAPPYEFSSHAVLWTGLGAIRDLGTLPGDTLSTALKINCFGQVIGSSGNTWLSQRDGEPGGSIRVIGRPFIWTQSKGMQDLNALIPANSGWVLNTATDINSWGQIVGQATRNGQPHGYLLTPLNPFQVF